MSGITGPVPTAAEVEALNVTALLSLIQAQVSIARAALADEHEGDLRSAVAMIEADAATLADLVRSW